MKQNEIHKIKREIITDKPNELEVKLSNDDILKLENKTKIKTPTKTIPITEEPSEQE